MPLLRSLCPRGWVNLWWIGEAKSHALLARRGLAPPLLAKFKNGLLYRFLRGQAATPTDLIRAPIWRGVARRLGQWHAVLPVQKGAMTMSPERRPLLGRVELLGPQGKAIATTTDDISPIQTRQAGPNLWATLQKWILALPRKTEQQRQRRKHLQKELERIIAELDDGSGIGEGGVWTTGPSVLLCRAGHPTDIPSWYSHTAIFYAQMSLLFRKPEASLYVMMTPRTSSSLTMNMPLHPLQLSTSQITSRNGEVTTATTIWCRRNPFGDSSWLNMSRAIINIEVCPTRAKMKLWTSSL